MVLKQAVYYLGLCSALSSVPSSIFSSPIKIEGVPIHTLEERLTEPSILWEFHTPRYWNDVFDVRREPKPLLGTVKSSYEQAYSILGQYKQIPYLPVVQMMHVDENKSLSLSYLFLPEPYVPVGGFLNSGNEMALIGPGDPNFSEKIILQRQTIEEPWRVINTLPQDTTLKHSISPVFFKTKNDKYIFVSQGSKSPDTFHTDFFIANANLELERASQIATPGYFTVNDAKETYDGGVVFVGNFLTSDQSDQALAVKFSECLENLVWSKTFGESGIDIFRSVEETKSKALIFAGESSGDRWLIRTDSVGNVHWDKKFGLGSPTRVIDLTRTPEGDLVMLYRTEQKSNCSESALGCYEWSTSISKIDEIGNFLWTKSLDTFSFSIGTGVQGNYEARGRLFTESEGVIIAGFTSFLDGHFNQKIVALKDDFLPWQAPINYPSYSSSPKKNLAMIVHGYNSFGKNNWPESMSNAIREKTNNWETQYYDWSFDAQKSFSKALATTTSHGNVIANYVEENDFEKVHLIGHSMGSWIIEEAARKIREKQPSTQIQLTFLDPFISNTIHANIRGSAHLGKSVQGLANSYAEQYYSDDILTGSYTGRCALPLLHNVSLNFLTGEFYTHEFPREWYEETIRYPESTIGSSAYGFVRSQEGGGYYEFETSKLLPRGNTAVFLGEGLRTPIQFGSWITGTSATGTVSVENGETILKTDGAMWAQANISLASNQNKISFSSILSGSNLTRFTMYLNNDPFFESDQRVATSQSNTELFLGDVVREGENTLSVRFEELEQDISVKRQTVEDSKLQLSQIEFSEQRVTEVPLIDHLLGKVILPRELGDKNSDGIIDSSDLRN